MNDLQTQKRMNEKRLQKELLLPDKYLLLIKGPRHAIVVEGRKNFAEHNSREATITAWFEFMCKLAECPAITKLNQDFRFTVTRTGIKPSVDHNMLIMEHIQDHQLLCFGGRVASGANLDPQAATLELMAYFETIDKIRDDYLQSILQEFCFGIYEL